MAFARHWGALVLMGGLLVAGCASSDPAAPAPTATVAGESDDLVVAVRIAAGSVSPADVRLETRVGRPIELVVDSDTDDELHVHATPEHTFAIAPGTGQRFRFTVDVPGRVEIELHHARRTVATLLVRG
jgi:multidrug efflux pump subunit AcrA (membrane-fusion protein)